MYRYKVWMDGCCLHEDDGFDTEEEATEEAQAWIEDIMDDWEMEGVLGDTVESDFNIETEEY